MGAEIIEIAEEKAQRHLKLSDELPKAAAV